MATAETKLIEYPGKIYRHFMHDSLYRNSIFLMFNTAILAIFGFLFWGLAVHIYSTGDIGLAATVITASGFISTLTIFGLDNAFIRYLPNSKNYNDFINTGLLTSTIGSLLAGIIYLVAIHFFILKLDFLDGSLLWMITVVFFMVVNTLNNLTNFAFIAFRITYLIFVINIGYGLIRLLALIAFNHYELSGLLASQVLAVTLALIFTIILMYKYIGYRIKPNLSKDSIKKMSKFAAGNYLSSMFFSVPSLIIPTIILIFLNPDYAAYYYVVTVIVNLLYIIPIAMSQSLFAEGAWNEDLLSLHFKKSLKGSLILVTAGIMLIMVFGKIILNIFGANYATQGYGLLIVLSLASLPKILSYLFATVLRIKHQIRSIIYIYLSYAIVIPLGCIISIHFQKGLMSFGWAILFGECLIAIVFSLVAFKYIKRESLPTNQKTKL